MSFVKWWVNRHSICKKCQDRWKKIKNAFGIKDAPKFVKVKAKTDEDVKELMELLFGKKEDKKDVSK
tara:strand:+ start:285 stop:485 length:201 start_codon:yes stop_codon:yes gene_type:complete